ncbi:hypothetical protein KK083_03385 [Fulvivirgaceae bacterium PWU4]|uniref:Apea-like HEPN domain-containing protein n=1 Tax=Chryseosolibacter histidini TaxID=2782349 RepID=A0AAP2GHC4_9BACT|nr:HEPN domain-containing protein [Chryseosolibacter histidini]MBT1695904.1 hypothetical protein [Chryseosolibacter histidini]
METIYGGLSGIEMSNAEFDFGNGIIIRKTYAHLTAPFIMAFKPPGKYKFHDGPWKPAKGGVSFDISAEIEVPFLEKFNDDFDQTELLWTVVSLLRIVQYAYISVPAISNISFNKVLTSEVDPVITPNEIKQRIFGPPNNENQSVKEDHLLWVKSSFERTLTLIKTNPNFYSAFKAFDSTAEIGKVSSSLVTLWGAIEQLFSPNTGELKYRVSANLAAFLSARGTERLKLFKEISKLYNDRSTAAHTAKDVHHSPLVATWVHLRNALIKIIQDGKVPSQDDLERLIFEE